MAKKVAKNTKKQHKKGAVIGKDKSKATKAKIHKLNEDLDMLNQVKTLETDKTKKALDVKQLKTDLNADKQKKANEKQLENGVMDQLELITGMGL